MPINKSELAKYPPKLQRILLTRYQAVVCQKLRKEKGMTIRQIAEVVGLSAMSVWRRLKIQTPYSNPYACNFLFRDKWRNDQQKTI